MTQIWMEMDSAEHMHSCPGVLVPRQQARSSVCSHRRNRLVLERELLRDKRHFFNRIIVLIDSNYLHAIDFFQNPISPTTICIRSSSSVRLDMDLFRPNHTALSGNFALSRSDFERTKSEIVVFSVSRVRDTQPNAHENYAITYAFAVHAIFRISVARSSFTVVSNARLPEYRMAIGIILRRVFL